ncbi:MAG: hypothetical protein IJ189_12055 [Clostridia bacterium]|nr:hypothetical protein [Clostridia bacterium]
MKKSIWLVLLIAIVAVVAIAVFAVQKDSLSTEVAKLQSEKEDLTKQLDEVDMAVRTTKELAETMVQEAEDKLTAVTAERDTLQADNEAKTAGIKQVQTVLNALVGDETALQLQEAQEALTAMTAERDALLVSLDEAKANAEALQAVTEERDTLLVAIENAKIEKVQAKVLNAEGEAVLELDDLSELKLNELTAGEYTVNVTVVNAAGEEAAQYSFPYVVAAAEAPAVEETAETEETAEPEASIETEEPVAEESVETEETQPAAETETEEPATETAKDALGDAA